MGATGVQRGAQFQRRACIRQMLPHNMPQTLRVEEQCGTLPLERAHATLMKCHSLKVISLESAAHAQTSRLPSKSGSGTTLRQKSEGEDRCEDNAPPADSPPPGSTEPWVKTWVPNADVLRAKHGSNRKYGRCNHESNVCVIVDKRGTSSHVASTHGTSQLPPSNCTSNLDSLRSPSLP